MMDRRSVGEKPSRNRPTLELSMIVKDGAAGLARCLESVDGIVDRILIGDTGSTDDSLSIARRYGADVFSVPWENDFSRARNHVLSNGQCDWILVLDADEMLDPSARSSIPDLIAQESMFAYSGWLWNYIRDLDTGCAGEPAVVNPVVIEQARPYPGYFRSFNTRLFRRHPAIIFEHCVHETVSDRIDLYNLSRGLGNFVIHHFGFVEDTKEDRKRKAGLYRRLGIHKLASEPDSYRANLEAGMSELDYANKPAAALPHFEAACSINPEMSMSWLYAGICFTRLAKFGEARDRLAHAAKLGNSSPLLYGALGDLHFQTADYANARTDYETAQSLGDASPLSQAKLGAAEVQLGCAETGIPKIMKAIERSPHSKELYAILATAALIAGHTKTSAEAAEHCLTLEGASGFDFVLAASIYLFTGNQARATAILHAGAVGFPDDADIKRLMAETSR